MRIFNNTVIDSGVMTGTDVINSEPVWLGHIVYWSAQIDYTKSGGTLTGAVKVQVSNADSVKSGDKIVPKDPIWTDLPSATASVTDAASNSLIINLVDAGYQWARIVYTNATGTGVINVKVNGKGQ